MLLQDILNKLDPRTWTKGMIFGSVCATLITVALLIAIIWWLTRDDDELFSPQAEDEPGYYGGEDFVDIGSTPSSFFEGSNTAIAALNKNKSLEIPSVYGGGTIMEKVEPEHHSQIYETNKELEDGPRKKFIVYEGMNTNFPPKSWTQSRTMVDFGESKKIGQEIDSLNYGVQQFQ